MLKVSLGGVGELAEGGFMVHMLATLTELGADSDNLHCLGSSVPELLPYSTILMARKHDEDLRHVESVYEWQEMPLAFLVDGTRLNEDRNCLRRIRRKLAMRGDAPYLGVVYPGRLDVYRIALDTHPLSKVMVDTGVAEDERRLTFARLGNLRPSAKINDKTWITGILLKLLDQALSALKDIHKLSGDDAISLVGRALFMRFLADRDLLPPIHMIAGGIGGHDELGLQAHQLFDSPELVRVSCDWLDKTFNGDLLPLSGGLFAALPPQACNVLGNIMRRAEGGQLLLGWQEGWNDLDFSHIPVGVLSQAYELYLRKHSPDKQQREGGFYTPHPIASLMVSAAFRRLNAEDASASAKILDPAAGAGVFLLTAFRELVAARWRRDGHRPDTATLRDILYNQIRGFDINEEALRFCALGLYLLSIELDPEPMPVDKLHFYKLRDAVLHRPIDTAEGAAPEEKQLGSLGTQVGAEHDGQYDLVIGNPPWASATGLQDWKHLLGEVHEIAKTRLGNDTPSPLLPNEVLDLPFVWRAMRWAKPGGQIVFALHARLLFQRGDSMPLARSSILEALDVTSIINGAEIRKTKVWPNVNAPFCLLFAVNRPAHAASGFRMITPRYEKDFNNAGVFRVDPANACVVRPQDVRERPETLKILFRGSEADLSLFDMMSKGRFKTLREYWDTLGDGGLFDGNGYQDLRDSTPKKKDGTRGDDASELHGLPHVYHKESLSLVIDTTLLPVFQAPSLHRKRQREIFCAPLLLIHQSPPAGTQRIQLYVCEKDVVYNSSWYGFSAKGISNAKKFIHYLALILGSRVAIWIALITSGKFGFEREVIEKSTMEQILIPPFEDLKPARVQESEKLFMRLARHGERAWPEIDAWVAKLYGLNERDLTVINDTLNFNLPYAANQERAQEPPSPDQIKTYCATLEKELFNFAQRFQCTVHVTPVNELHTSPWKALRVAIRRNDRLGINMGTSPDISALTAMADRMSATEVILEDSPHGLIVILLAQARHWSETQARLVAQHIIWQRPDAFREHAQA
jgi:hypothetical protein